MYKTLFLDNQIGLFTPDKNRGIRRYFNELCLVRESLNFNISVPKLNLFGSSVEDSPNRITYLEEKFNAGVTSRFWFKANVFESALRSKINDLTMPSFYFPEYLEKYLENSSRLILPVYDMIPELFSNEYPELNTAHAAKSEYLKFAEIVICISEETKFDLVTFFPSLSANQIEVIEPFFKLPDSAKLLSFFGSKSVEETNSLQLLHIGDRSFYKNFSEVAEAVISANMVTNLRVVGGGSPTPLELGLALRAQENGNSIIFLGSISDDDLENEYHKADFTVIGSRKEGFGFAFVESLTRGTPVIARSPNMWGEFPFVISQIKLNFDDDQILEMKSTAISSSNVIELWDRLNLVRTNSLDKLNILFGGL
jgi:hypothetical protein